MIYKMGGFNLKLSNYSSAVRLVDNIDVSDEKVMDNNIKKLITEMEKMKNMHILQNSIPDYEEENIEYSVYGREYNNLKQEYIVNKIGLTTDGVEALHVEIEEKTGKILYYISTSNYNIVGDINEEEILRNYIKYLDLYIIDDWKFENNILISEKSRLMACLIKYSNYQGSYVLAIYSTNNEHIRERFNLK